MEEFWCKIFKLSLLGHQSRLDVPLDESVFAPPENGHPPELLFDICFLPLRIVMLVESSLLFAFATESSTIVLPLCAVSLCWLLVLLYYGYNYKRD